MPVRNIPLVNSEIYHIVNRGVASQPIFLSKLDYKKAISAMFYYQNYYSLTPFSRLSRLKSQKIPTTNPPISLLAYCLMPNHLHLLIKQNKDNGIMNFMRIVSNSYAKYFNTKNHRFGPLFQGRFKAVHIENDNQLLHVSRYIHLNPYSSFIIKTKEEILTYPYSSIESYLQPKYTNQISTKEILSHFSKTQTYKDFLLDQADYQQSLDLHKHLTLE